VLADRNISLGFYFYSTSTVVTSNEVTLGIPSYLTYFCRAEAGRLSSVISLMRRYYPEAKRDPHLLYGRRF
jgi:hypothetical protein